MTINKLNIEDILFIDIETVPGWKTIWEAPDEVQREFIYKFKFADNAPPIPDSPDDPDYDDVKTYEYEIKRFNDYIERMWNLKAGLHAEFSRIVCICVGIAYEGSFRVKRYYGASEEHILTEFRNDLAAFADENKNLRLCGHYIKGFDIPFLCRRLLINRLPIPPIIDSYGLKPWEIMHLDTHEIWKFGIGSSATLSSIAMAFGLPCPKDDIDGSMVAEIFFNGEFSRIATYCAKDVVTNANIFKCIRLELPYTELDVHVVDMENDDIPF